MAGAFVYEVGNWPDYKTIEKFYDKSIWGQIWFKLAAMLGTALILILPLNLQKDITKFRFTSIFGIFCLFLVTIILIVELPDYISYNNDKYEKGYLNWYDFSTGFTVDLYFLKGCATLFYAYNCHMGVYPTMKN